MAKKKKPRCNKVEKYQIHLESLKKVKEEIIDKFESNIYQVFFLEELLAMDCDLMILNYANPSMLILGHSRDFGERPPDDPRNDDQRLKARVESRKSALDRFLMIGCGVDVGSAMVMTHPILFEKWTTANLAKKRSMETMRPTFKFRIMAGRLAKMMIEKDALKRQLIILGNLSSGTLRLMTFLNNDILDYVDYEGESKKNERCSNLTDKSSIVCKIVNAKDYDPRTSICQPFYGSSTM